MQVTMWVVVSAYEVIYDANQPHLNLILKKSIMASISGLHRPSCIAGFCISWFTSSLVSNLSTDALKLDAKCCGGILKAGRGAAVSFHSSNCGLKQITVLALAFRWRFMLNAQISISMILSSDESPA